MYIDAIVLLIILVLVATSFKRYYSFAFIVAIIDISLRIINFIKINTPLSNITLFMNKYLPDSIFAIIDKYTKGILNTSLKWVFVVIMGTFLYYIIKIFIKRKRI